MDIRSRILGEQALIAEILGRIETIVRTGAGSELRSLGRERRRLAKALSEHLSLMELEVYPTLLARSAPAQRETIVMMRAEGRVRALDYRTHLADWNADNLLSRWDDYGRATIARINLIREHLDHSRRYIHPLLAAIRPTLLSSAA